MHCQRIFVLTFCLLLLCVIRCDCFVIEGISQYFELIYFLIIQVEFKMPMEVKNEKGADEKLSIV